MALMSEPVASLQDDTRKQLGAFLRARRESLDPQRLGLPRSGRRRTPVCDAKRWRCSPTWV